MKVILAAHTHWDREWYFTTEVSENLLKYFLDNIFNDNAPLDSFYLDGQVSILEDYMNYASEINQNKMRDYINQGKIIVGPLYTQPDVFNALGETTIRNIELGQRILKKFNFQSSKIMYCPDTFGFNANFPQILKHTGFDKFIFWRGLSHEWKDSDFNLWKGIDGTIIKTYRYKSSYVAITRFVNYESINKENVKAKAKEFVDNFENNNKRGLVDHFRAQAAKNNGVVIFPVGKDQIPYHPYLRKFFEYVNKFSNDEWVFGRHDDFFNLNKTAEKTIEGAIDYGYESKIHRSIATSRYDFKKLFRQSEINLFHQLEPLELFYKLIDLNYTINNENILKTLSCMQAHDVLGGCITDNVQTASIQKLVNLNDNIESKKQIIMKQLAQELKLETNNLLLFNPNFAQYQNNVCFYTIYTENFLEGSYLNDQYEIHVLNSKPFDGVESSFESNLLIINKSLKPFGLTIIDLKKLKKNFRKQLKFNEYKKFLNFKIYPDEGDAYDSDIMEELIFNHDLKIKTSTITKLGSINYINVQGEIVLEDNQSEFELAIIETLDDYYYDLKITNNFANIIIKWIPPLNFQSKIRFLQHLGIEEYKADKILNWKELGYKEAPVNLKKNSGLIFDDKYYVCTEGTNQFSWINNELEIVLYRTTGVLGKRNLKIRPGLASGIDGHVMFTPSAQMIGKNLQFDFSFGKYENNVHNKLNSFYRRPILFHLGSKYLLKPFMEKFYFIEKNLKIKSFNFDLPNGFISSSYFENELPTFRIVNFDKNLDYFNKINKAIITK